MTELIWDGKYDAQGRRVAPLRVRLPFQTVETVNESAQERNLAFDLFAQGRDPQWRNRLIWGDKKYVLPALLDEFAGKVDLIYIDPPFDTGANFSFHVEIEGEDFTKEPSIIEQKAYRDTWGRGATHLDSYLQWFYESAILLRDLLAETGSIFVHVGWQVSSAVRLVLDEVFGFECHLNEIIWQRTPHAGSSKARSTKFPVNHECIYWYSKGDKYTFRNQYIPYEEKYTGRFSNPDNDPRGPWQSVSLRTFSEGTFERLKQENKLIAPQRVGAGWRYKWFLEETKGKQTEDIWLDVSAVNSMAVERTTYPTQKPEALLERIINASSSEGDLVLDCFCGSGTTASVAEDLGRRWIAADLGRFAVHTTRKRLLLKKALKPFVVQNLGKYERQVWQAAEFGERAEAAALAYRAFILDLYAARALTGYTWLHGLKNGRMVHVGSVDAPVSPGDVTNIVTEFRRTIGTGADAPKERGVDVLGWDFAFELHEVAKQQAALAGIDVRFVRIPREVLEKKAVEQGDIRFFELAALAVDVQQKGRSVTLTLSDFVIPLDDVPEDVQRAITHWSQWVDYWAVDWDNKGDTFHNEWQSYRTRASKDLQKQIAHTYDQPGTYTIVVKVIDLLGNDTTKVMNVVVEGT